jgi:hypothetical protein
MSTLAPLLQAFFTERLIGQRDASPHTVASYRDAICLLLRFAHQRTGKPPHQLGLDDLDAPLIGAFLAHLETARAASVRTRNARLTAIRSLFGFAAYRLGRPIWTSRHGRPTATSKSACRSSPGRTQFSSTTRCATTPSWRRYCWP